MTTKIEQLKRNIDQAQNSGEIWTAIWSVFDYLQKTEEREVEIKKIKNVYQDCPNCEQDNCLILNDMKYCPGCGAKIKRID